MNVLSLFANEAIMGAISSSVLIILLGFYLTKVKVLNDVISKGLSTVILSVGLPALAFTSFMQDINQEIFSQGLTILVWGFIFQGALIFLLKVYYTKYKGDEKQALVVLTTLGSTTFFGIPIIGAVYGAQGVLFASIFNISYRVYLYSWGYVSFSSLKLSKENFKNIFLNPIILATFLGLFIWLFQAHLPQIAIVGKDGNEKFVAFARIDKTLPWLMQTLKYLSSLTSPLAWLSIGSTLAQISLKEAFVNRTSWVYSLTKILVVPALCLLGLLLLKPFMSVSFLTVAVSMIMMATPPATVAVAYSIKFDKASLLSSNCSLVATVLAVAMMPVMILFLEIIKALNLFV